ncbi:hypothetical protein POX_h09621 [Penicillium oxalicum]|uniref:hypothetical protein n=1 Tax=Penicillium oxalicum TaxID=69781 RepID=UPI0020B8C4B6|nr:hypothetical protein POX_h09621 [Penicillium oxalicum]KAI2785859.1 hypothetical protein POX_h09621 [Penicillium oxalicum]
MGAGAILEPLTVIVLLFGGTWINRATKISSAPRIYVRRQSSEYRRTDSSESLDDNQWHTRQLRILGHCWSIWSPNSEVFSERLLSRLLRKLPFLVECWYWALVYWTYQLGRAFTALTLKDDTVDVARRHALSVIDVEKSLGIFWELDIQRFFLRHPTVMMWINWIYSFIHIPGTIAFLVWLYYYTTTRNRIDEAQSGKPRGAASGSPAGPLLYQARRRTMAVCNLLAFVVFTLWPCMPPRLLSDPNVEGPEGELSRSYGFVDTVHGENGAGSVWTQNRFCNQYAAMPSLHFGYALMIGTTIMTIPLPSQHRRPLRVRLGCGPGLRLHSWRRMLCLTLGFLYPFTILVAIVATANHFILDAAAGALVCALGWNFNGILLNLLPFEDYFLWLVRIHKPEPAFISLYTKTVDDWDSDDAEIRQAVLPW